MAKRGRPNIYDRAGMSIMKTGIDNTRPDETERGKANFFYQSIGLMQANAANDAAPVPCFDKMTKHPGGILEQLGRMEYQDGFPDDLIQEYARQAGELLEAGWKKKDIEKSLRNVRKDIKEAGALDE